MINTWYFRVEMNGSKEVDAVLRQLPIKWKRTRFTGESEMVYCITAARSVWIRKIKRALKLKKRDGMLVRVC